MESTTMTTMNTALMEPLLTVAEVAALLKVCRLTVYRLRDRGELPAVKVGCHLRFRPDDVEEFTRPEGPATNL